MSLYHKTKRIAKLGFVCLATYYVAKSCDQVVFGQEPMTTIEEKVRTYEQPRDSVRTLDAKTLR